MAQEIITKNFSPLFDPKSVAVIGATDDWNKWGFSTFLSTLDGFKGKVYPINNTKENILGHKAFKKITDVPGEVDLAAFVIPSASIPAVMEDCVRKGVKAAVIISAGFTEIGEEGSKLQDEVLEIARRGGIRFVGPNCMGFWSATSELRAFMTPLQVRPGPFAFVTQGGNVGGAIVTSAYQKGLGFHRYVSCGGTADIQIEDYIEHFGEDPEVKVILTYIEGLKDGRRFVEKVKKITPKKPVIALKPGKSEATAHAIMSHSGSLCGSDKIYEEAFTKAGVIRVETPEELLDVAIGFLTQPLPQGKNVAITTPGGSYGVLCTDDCSSNNLNVVNLSPETITKFNQIFPPRWSRGNPVDPAGDRNLVAYLKAPQMLLELNEVDSLVFMGMGSFSNFTGNLNTITPQFPAYEKMSKLPEKRDVHSLVSFISPLLWVSDNQGKADLETLISSVVESGEIDISSFWDDISSSIVSDGKIDPTQIFSFMDTIIGGLVLHWIKTYKKPIVPTTFTDEGSHLDLRGGFYYSYPSPQRAVKVLAKLVEYKEYLERC